MNLCQIKQGQKKMSSFFGVLFIIFFQKTTVSTYTKTSSNHIYKQRTLKKSVHDVLMNYNECLFYKHKNSVKVCNVGACAGKPVEEIYRKNHENM